MKKYSLGIIGIGPNGSRYATKVVAGLFWRRKNRYINSVALYNYHNDNLLSFLRQLGVNYQKPLVNAPTAPMNENIQNTARLLQVFERQGSIRKTPSLAILFVDMEQIEDTVTSLSVFCGRNPNMAVMVVCFCDSLQKNLFYQSLNTMEKLHTYYENVLPPILIDVQSDLNRIVPELWEAIIIRSLVFSLIETMTSNHAHMSIDNQLKRIDSPFAGVGITSQGVSPETIGGKILFFLFRRWICFLPVSIVLKRMIDSTRNLLMAQPPMGSIGKIDFNILQQHPIALSFLVPYRKGGRKYKDLISRLELQINDDLRNVPVHSSVKGYGNVPAYSSVKGNGIDISSIQPQSKGNFHVQTMLIYPYP